MPGSIGSFKAKDCSGTVEVGQATNPTSRYTTKTYEPPKCIPWTPASDAQAVGGNLGQGPHDSFHFIDTFNDTQCSRKALIGHIPNVPCKWDGSTYCFAAGTPTYGNITGMQAFSVM